MREARLAKGWSLRTAAEKARMSVSAVHGIESGQAGSLDAYCRLGAALGLRPELEFTDARKLRPQGRDAVHAAMGEIEVDRLSGFGFGTGVDEPYQHFQFAGRADVVAWSVASRTLLHIENRTMFPDIQETAGSWNAKRVYLPAELAKRIGVRGWASITNLMVGVWSAELIDEVRRHLATFHSICPDAPDGFNSWWHGESPVRGTRSEFVVLDPIPRRGTISIVTLDEALEKTPRHARYAEIVRKLGR